ncbi:ComEA family DNA-binding protein [Paenibacillus sp. FSL R5-0345]|uniref:ComEA family DNA-binding protein n=1 Tax=Paenibacillus sp. FSL R5-0345 TaxID=1536770 RepID=UPI0006932BBF|nr:ComEA family DNA-binding protein [Paenibacillus sp. FSL R5-0345]
MNKGRIVLGVAVALLGSGLLWVGGSKGNSGIAGWETLNASMEQTIGIAEPDEASAIVGKEGSQETKDQKKNAGKAEASDRSDVAEKVKDGEQADHAASTPADEKGTTTAGQNAAGDGMESGGQTQTAGEGQTPAGGNAAASAGALEVPAPATSQEGKVNVNTAGARELMDLPGIGEKKAQAMIDYRNREGAFRNLSDLGKVKGIGPKILEKLKPLVVF